MRIPAHPPGLNAASLSLLQARPAAAVARVPGEAGDPSSAANPGGGRRLNPHAVERPIGPEHGTAPPPRGSIINIVV